ncbi:hypothetical protein [Aquimarina brevivitae]|uniref:Uncharacterized protein n=1 Tax=Aquimarina brevivitae TaxID=323412 RepID=A0A4Q7NXE9_9FLAO|nr:hypothetical protein [Aquimarina brevivitae]RZS91897.1 hypothetical protein EV197_3001 [Aquimarina brevivitae]
MQKIIAALCIFLWGNASIKAQSETFNPEVKKYFLITYATKNYEAAFHHANDISKKLALKLDLRELQAYDKTLGLTWAASICEGDGWEYPCYIPRGRYDDGIYVSIEWSDGYKNFSKGYYIVMVASTQNFDKDLKKLLNHVQTHIPDAYIKSSMIYMGCMH